MTQQIIALLATWQQRQNTSNNADYKVAIAECYDELQQILHTSQDYKDYMDKYFNSLSDEELAEYFYESEADLYLASMEAQEPAA